MKNLNTEDEGSLGNWNFTSVLEISMVSSRAMGHLVDLGDIGEIKSLKGKLYINTHVNQKVNLKN